MLRNFKINSAVLICMAFVFRLLFVNIGVVSSLNTRQFNSHAKHHFSTLAKKGRSLEASDNSGTRDYLAIEICEEDSDEENEIKSDPSSLLQVLYCGVVSKINDGLKKITATHHSLSYTATHRYLAFKVFRI